MDVRAVASLARFGRALTSPSRRPPANMVSVVNIERGSIPLTTPCYPVISEGGCSTAC